MIISHPAYKEYQKKPLTLHLTNVANGCKARIQRLSLDTKTIDKDNLSELAFRIGLLHDIGKASSYFQDYIRGGTKNALTNHSLVSALILYLDITQDNRFRQMAPIAFRAVQRHHGNLCTFSPDDIDNGPLIQNTIRICNNIRDQICHDSQLSRFMEANSITLPQLDTSNLRKLAYRLPFELPELTDLDNAIERFFVQNLLYSVLIDSDKHDAARIESVPDENLSSELSYSPHVLIQSMDASASELNSIRSRFLGSVENAAAENPGKCYAMSAPTGSGKTLACLGFTAALQSTLLSTRRVIYCLPYTSIVDQNYEVIDKVLQKNGLTNENFRLLLKHHHLVDYSQSHKSEDYDYQDYMNDQLIADSWNSACIVSTFVQLFHSLIGSRNSLVRKLHNIMNSIILLDEVQSLPPKYYVLLRRIFAVLAQRFDTYILTCTATQPFIFEPGSFTEVAPDDLFQNQIFNRVKLHLHKEVMTLEAFVESISDLDSIPNALFVLNTKRCAIELYHMLKERYEDSFEIFCLTTLHIPMHRLECICRIRKALAKGRRILLISTQLIEAGVDLSFARVYRDMGPLDSIVQVAGRCNRNSEYGVLGGDMHLLMLAKEDKPYYRNVYDNYIIDKTMEILNPFQKLESLDFTLLIQNYYRSLEFGAEAKALLKALADLNYDQKTSDQIPIDKFRLIEDDYAFNSVYILFDEIAAQAMADLILAKAQLKSDSLDRTSESQARLTIKRAYHTLANYQLNLSSSELKNYGKQMSYYEQLDDYVFYISYDGRNNAYSKETGFIIDPQDTGACLAF